MSISCSFCIHVNPEGSKYCNECGSPLRLKPCPDCDAVNDHDASECHQCGATLGGGSGRAHELAESVRARESESCAHGSAESPGEREFFDQYLTALRRDMAGRSTPAEEIASDEPSGPPPKADDPARAAPAIHAADAQPTADPGPTPREEPDTGTVAQSSRAAPAESDGRSTAQARPLPPSRAPGRRADPHAAQAPQPMHPASPARPRRSVLSPTLYVVGAGLLVVGMLGYGHYLRDPLPRIEQWVADMRSRVAASRPAIKVSRSITGLPEAAAPAAGSDPAAGAEHVAAPVASPTAVLRESASPPSRTDAASAGVEAQGSGPTSIPSTPSSVRSSPAAVDPPTPSPAQPAATTEAQSSPAEPARAAASAPASAGAPDDTGQALQTPQHPVRTGPKQPRQRGAARGVAATSAPPPTAPVPAESTDTGTTTASPLAPICTKGIAALGLCDPNSREAN